MRTHPVAFLACAASAALEGVLAGREPNKVLASYRQPSWAPPPWAWYIIGLAYYAACYLAIYRLMRAGEVGRFPLGLVFAVMLANAAWNVLFFRARNLKAVHYFNLIYALLVGGMIVAAVRVDPMAVLLFGLYAAYLPYAIALGFQWWKLNS